MKLLVDIPKKIVTAIQNGENYRYDIHTAIAQGIPCEESSGDLISREALKEALHNEIGDHALSIAIDRLIDKAPTVETSKIEYKAYNEGFKDGVDQGIKLSERPQGNRRTPVYDNDGSYVAIQHRVVITKEEFLSCYKEWVLKSPVSMQFDFYIPVGNNGNTPV